MSPAAGPPLILPSGGGRPSARWLSMSSAPTKSWLKETTLRSRLTEMIAEAAAPKQSKKKISAVDWPGLRADFPILDQRVHGQPLIYFDNAATTQKPRPVLEALRHYYDRANA